MLTYAKWLNSNRMTMVEHGRIFSFRCTLRMAG